MPLRMHPVAWQRSLKRWHPETYPGLGLNAAAILRPCLKWQSTWPTSWTSRLFPYRNNMPFAISSTPHFPELWTSRRLCYCRPVKSTRSLLTWRSTTTAFRRFYRPSAPYWEGLPCLSICTSANAIARIITVKSPCT
ncbi:hypothetical protein SDC9_100264 [bioreactor metagenome]|uniref:Uncharacterized protein n=1 Tax=bioreactor metagenome TaxID=1076179 RepID=A0A645AKN5_9ZZZZ